MDEQKKRLIKALRETLPYAASRIEDIVEATEGEDPAHFDQEPMQIAQARLERARAVLKEFDL
jgi:RNA binding exosome subunit